MPCASEWIGCLALQIFDTCGSQMQGWCWTFALVHPQCEFRSALLGDWRGNLRWWGVFSHQNDFVSVTQLSDIGGSLGWTWNWPHSVRGAKVWWTATQTLMDDKEYPCTVQRSPRLYRLNAGEKLTVEPNPEEVEAEKGHQTCHSVRQVTVCHRTLVAWSRLEPASAEASLQAIRWLGSEELKEAWNNFFEIFIKLYIFYSCFWNMSFGPLSGNAFVAIPLGPCLSGPKGVCLSGHSKFENFCAFRRWTERVTCHFGLLGFVLSQLLSFSGSLPVQICCLCIAA